MGIFETIKEQIDEQIDSVKEKMQIIDCLSRFDDDRGCLLLSADEIAIVQAGIQISINIFEKAIDKYREYLNTDLSKDKKIEYEREIEKCEKRIEEYRKVLNVRVLYSDGFCKFME